MFIDVLFGSRVSEPVLLYLQAYEEGYANEMARSFGIPLNMVQKQLAKYEAAGVLVSRKIGNVRLFSWNPRWPFLGAFRAWLQEVFEAIPTEMKKKFYVARRRPRKTGKSLWLKSTKRRR